MKKTMILALVALLAMGCEKEIDGSGDGSVRLTFVPTTADVHTRGSAWIGDFFTKLNVMVFDAEGEKVLSQVKTQTVSDADFGTMSIGLPAGSYTVVAVGHSSIKSATIKSPQMVQFTASDGEKLTDTFCYCGKVMVGEDSDDQELVMNRVTAMVRFRLDDVQSGGTAFGGMSYVKIDYTGGSANFNPSTMEGTTKSSQSEKRAVSESGEYRVFTFPYMSKDGKLKMTISAVGEDGAVFKQKTIDNVPVTRNRITTYTGKLLEDGDGEIVQTWFGINVNGEWDGEDYYSF